MGIQSIFKALFAESDTTEFITFLDTKVLYLAFPFMYDISTKKILKVIIITKLLCSHSYFSFGCIFHCFFSAVKTAKSKLISKKLLGLFLPNFLIGQESLVKTKETERWGRKEIDSMSELKNRLSPYFSPRKA